MEFGFYCIVESFREKQGTKLCKEDDDDAADGDDAVAGASDDKVFREFASHVSRLSSFVAQCLLSGPSCTRPVTGCTSSTVVCLSVCTAPKANSTRMPSLEVASTTLKAAFYPIVNFRLAVTYFQFPIQVCFSATVCLSRDWFSQFHFRFSIETEHFRIVTSNFDCYITLTFELDVDNFNFAFIIIWFISDSW